METEPRPHRTQNLLAWILGILAALIAGWFYLPTIHPGVGPYLDSVEFQKTAWSVGILHPPGYPLYTALGALFTRLPLGGLFSQIAPWGDNPAWRLNFFSAVTSLLAIVTMTRLIWRLTGNALVGMLGALTLGAAVRFWYQGTYSELYGLYSLMLALTFTTLIAWMQTKRPRFYFTSAFLMALCFGVNIPAMVVLPAWLLGVGLTDWRVLIRPRTLIPTILLVLLAASQYLYIPLRSFVFGPPDFCNYCPTGWDDTVPFLTGERWRDLNLAFGLDRRYWLQRSADAGYELMLNFWPTGVLFGGIGVAWLFQQQWKIALTLFAALAGTWFFVMTYNVVDWRDFTTPPYLFFTPFVGCGIWAAVQWVTAKVKSHGGRIALTYLLLLIPSALILATFLNNRPIVQNSPNQNMFWHWRARELLPQFEPDALLLTPPPNTDGFVQTWAIRYVSWTEGLAADMTMVYPPIDEAPPGPAPGYASWDAVKNDLHDRAVYVIELNDPRLSKYVLQPLLDGEAREIGYRIVGERRASAVDVWIDDSLWNEIEATLLFP